MPRKKKIETELGAPAEYVDEAPEQKENIIPEKIFLLKPATIIIDEDMDLLQLIDDELSNKKGSPGYQIAVVDSEFMNGIRGRGRQEIIRKFKIRAASLGYEVKKTHTKIP